MLCETNITNKFKQMSIYTQLTPIRNSLRNSFCFKTFFFHLFFTFIHSMPFTSKNAAKFAKKRHNHEKKEKVELHQHMKMMRRAKAAHKSLDKGTYSDTVAIYSTHSSRHASVAPPIENIEVTSNAPTLSDIQTHDGSPGHYDRQRQELPNRRQINTVKHSLF